MNPLSVVAKKCLRALEALEYKKGKKVKIYKGKIQYGGKPKT